MIASKSPHLVLASYIGQLPYTPQDLINVGLNIDDEERCLKRKKLQMNDSGKESLNPNLLVDEEVTKIIQLDLCHIYGRPFCNVGSSSLLLKPSTNINTEVSLLSPRSHVSHEFSETPKKNNKEVKKGDGDPNGVVIHSNCGRKVVTIDAYMKLINIWQPQIVIAPADEICASICGHKRIQKATERTLKWFAACNHQLKSLLPYSPTLFAVPVYNPAVPHQYQKTISNFIENGAKGIVISCHLGESDSERQQMVALALSITLPLHIPTLIQGCDTIEHILEAMEMGVDFISSNCPQLLTSGGFAIAFDTNQTILEKSPVEIGPESCRSTQPNPNSLSGIVEAIEDNEECVDKEMKSSKGSVTKKHCLNMWNDCHRKDTSPLVRGCECHACQYYSRAYIHHLLIVKEILAEVLLYQHNQYRLLQLFSIARKKSQEGSLHDWLSSFDR
mmetsp:Transcript_8142/g.12162  ORF Transcript_8142/g.12162 Transcript_8142/m.12162 type:complete len:446 (+) Transcript_8142:43-1380(+)